MRAKYFLGILKRLKVIGLVGTIVELYKYYLRYSRLPSPVYTTVSLNYKLFVIYTYIKLTYFLYAQETNDILDFVPRRIQIYLLPIINPLKKKDVLVDKIKFYRLLSENNLPHPEIYFYIKNGCTYDLYDNKLKDISKYDDKFIYVKIRDGSSGKGAEIIKFSNRNTKLRDNCIYQERLRTSHLLKDLADVESFNTCRVSSYIDNDGKITIDLAYLKLGGKGNAVDNIASGGIGVPIDIESGRLHKIGFVEFGDSFEVEIHPYGKKKFEGFVVPEWDNIKNTVLRAHEVFKELRHISWDIGLTDEGPVFVEGNSGGDIFANQLVGNKRYYNHKLITDTFGEH